MLDPLLQPTPSFDRWFGHIVIELKLWLFLNLAARHNIRSTSSSGPVNLYWDLCLSMSLSHDSSGTILASRFRSLASQPQTPPTRDLKEQQPSIFSVINLTCKIHSCPASKQTNGAKKLAQPGFVYLGSHKIKFGDFFTRRMAIAIALINSTEFFLAIIFLNLVRILY